MKITSVAVALAGLLLSSCQKNGELTRELATPLLNDYLAKLPTQKIQFNGEDGRDGLRSAELDGIIITTSYPHHFTATGLALGGGFFSKNIAIKESVVEYGRFVSLTKYFVSLTKPTEERVAEVTGIGLGQNPNSCDVEFVTKYSIPESARGMLKYIESGRKLKCTLRRYDDGWRVEESEK